jgi:hypothetical protein
LSILPFSLHCHEKQCVAINSHTCIFKESDKNKIEKKDLKGGVMVKQDQNCSPQSNRERKQSQANSPDSHKENASEKRKAPTRHENPQNAKYQKNKNTTAQQKLPKPQDFDRNEGEGRSQKL